VARVRATPRRIRNEGSRRRAVTIAFTLTSPARVVFVVRGPGPSCDLVGRFAVRGHAGANQVRFTGRIGRRELPEGTYRITARTAGGRAARPVVVAVGSGPLERPICARGESGTGALSVFEQLAAAFAVGGPTGSPTPPRKDLVGAVLPAIKKKARQATELPKAVPTPPIGRFSESTRSPTMLIGLGVGLGMFAVAMLALIAYGARFVRRAYLL
jgi:hypothetical protein